MEVFKQILSKQETAALDGLIMSHLFQDKMLERSVYCFGYSGNVSETDVFSERIEQQVQQICKKDIKFSHSFSRIYVNDSYLDIHTDRPGLDVTVSLCIRKDTKQDWPLCVSRQSHSGLWNEKTDGTMYKKDFVAINLEPGDAGFVYGTMQPHWRDRLVCNEGEKNIYVFYHWTFV